jgi:hypothetical protein
VGPAGRPTPPSSAAAAAAATRLPALVPCTADAEAPARPRAAVLIEEPPAIAGIKSSIITMMNSAIGAGILSLPYAFRCTGWAAGIAAIVLLGAAEAYTAYVLCRFAEHTGSKTYGVLVSRKRQAGQHGPPLASTPLCCSNRRCIGCWAGAPAWPSPSSRSASCSSRAALS